MVHLEDVYHNWFVLRNIGGLEIELLSLRGLCGVTTILDRFDEYYRDTSR